MNGHLASHAADVGTQVIGNCLKRTLLDTGGASPAVLRIPDHGIFCLRRARSGFPDRHPDNFPHALHFMESIAMLIGFSSFHQISADHRNLVPVHFSSLHSRAMHHSSPDNPDSPRNCASVSPCVHADVRSQSSTQSGVLSAHR